MSQPIIYIDKSEIREGKLEKLKGAMDHLASFVEKNIPRIISYAFYLDAENKQMTVISVHPDSACLIDHMDRGNEEFRKFGTLIKLSEIEIYGGVSEEVLTRLHNKAEMLGSGTVKVYDFFAGFARRI